LRGRLRLVYGDELARGNAHSTPTRNTPASLVSCIDLTPELDKRLSS
jgi:hypothetical protein